MNLLSRCSNAVIDFPQAAFQSIGKGVIKLKKYRNNPEIFQKTAQIAISIIQYYNWHHGIVVYPKLERTLSTANMHDFYQILKEPRGFLCPIKAESINAPQALENIVNKLCVIFPNFDRGALRQTVQKHLQAQLDSMVANDDAYTSTEDFALALQNRLQEPIADLTSSSILNVVDLNDVKIPVIHRTLVDKIVDVTGLFINMGCVGLYTNAWNLVDTGAWAMRIGQNSGFGWVKYQSLETWVRGGVTFAFGAKLFEATRKLLDEKLTPTARRNAKIDAISSLFEFVYQGVGYLNHRNILKVSPGLFYAGAIITKGVGIACVLARPKPNYFETMTA
ncbi:hypothetical protein [Candidatus Protochlamydia amoebophila]|uniref:Uncharacterized protein n=1 Tax=Protochlamydia amoebophila (strain UWE25) TaxID=264201 RepID=Q6ME67_PARUW|nr:hypothetical protein [Candidatus Protochlamydia amoebophila]CAF23132.1 unnamed protein product [Candidatus Protochlamydia amoebophila UWE25]